MNIPHLDSKGGMVGKFSVAAHLKAIEKTDLVTGNEWEVLPSHDVTVTTNGNNTTSCWGWRTNEMDVNRDHVLLAPLRPGNRYLVYQIGDKEQV